jgi:hypothetical protein
MILPGLTQGQARELCAIRAGTRAPGSVRTFSMLLDAGLIAPGNGCDPLKLTSEGNRALDAYLALESALVDAARRMADLREHGPCGVAGCPICREGSP